MNINEPEDPDLRRAFNEGMAARSRLKRRACGFHNKDSVAHNPYNGHSRGVGKRLRAAWHNGWITADKERR